MIIMESYEEEGEIIPHCVINYYIVDDNNQPVSFSVLPPLWSGDETPGDSDTQIFLWGTAVTGQKLYKKIIAWRPEISYALPMIYVLSEDKFWMQLRRPKKSFEDTVMSTLITVHCLHFLKWNLKADINALWIQLHKAFSTYVVAPSKSHLLCQLPLIKEAALRDKDLAKSELLPTLLLQIPTYELNRAFKNLKLEVDSQEDYEDNDNDEDDETFHSVCVLCDDGGLLICCEGKCLRSFHPNINAGVESSCESLGYSDAQIEALQTFFCNNCQYQQHQCFVCGKLGSSDQSSVPEVFQCANADCYHFYHPNCVAKLLQPCDTLKTKELQLKIHSGESFVCPAHKCNICMENEDKSVHELQFAMCRRCPKAYHRKCLPREITFKSEGNIPERAWDGLLSGHRVLIYCMDHEILAKIGTPKRDHIIFPNVEGKMRTTSGLLSSKEKLIKSRDFGNFTPRSPLKQRVIHAGIHCGHSTSATFTGEKVSRHTNIDKIKLSTPQRTVYLPNSSKGKIADYQNQSADKFKKVKGSSSQPAVDAELKSRMLKLIKDSTSSFNMEEFLKSKKSSSLYSSHVRIAEDKTFTEGKVKGYVKIVDRLKWYVQDGDTIVDFCCGSNDFSCLMRERLHNMGKVCSFKNYDLLNDFNVEQRDWMTVTLEELPPGSNLIMGLNPPFGVDGCLANKFIDKALTFKPKLLILIVPMQTERLDRKKEFPYDIIWEDHLLLSGKAFDLPGSVEVNDKQLEQHNNLALALYLWSRPDWTAKHKAIAETCGHGTVTYDPIQMGKMDTGENHDGMHEGDMEVDSPIYLPNNSTDHIYSSEWSFKGFQPSHYTSGMQHSSVVSDAAAMAMQHPSVVSDAMQGFYHEVLPQHPSVVSDATQGFYHEVLPQHPSVVSDAVESVHQGAYPPHAVKSVQQGDYPPPFHHGAFPPPCQYPTQPYFYPGWPRPTGL